MPEKITGIQTSVLRWARESQGYSVEEVSSRLKRNPAEIAAWEAGEASPTYVQLETLAYKVYKRPLTVFFCRNLQPSLTPNGSFVHCQTSIWKA
ncbi:hypothetical protein BH20ACI3_BH20ACI3_16560 [soil metagenome]